MGSNNLTISDRVHRLYRCCRVESGQVGKCDVTGCHGWFKLHEMRSFS